jgi:hypothetical protein
MKEVPGELKPLDDVKIFEIAKGEALTYGEMHPLNYNLAVRGLESALERLRAHFGEDEIMISQLKLGGVDMAVVMHPNDFVLILTETQDDQAIKS